MTVAGILPRSASSLDHVRLWDEGCVNTRLKELKALFMTKLEFDEQAKLRQEHFRKMLKLKKPLPRPQSRELSQGEKEERYGEKASELANEVFEQERQNYIDARSERDKNVIAEIARKLRFLVWTVDEEGKPTKLKVIVERVVRPSDQGGTQDIQYVGDRDFERLHQINALKLRLEQLRTYLPYYSEEIKKLHEEAVDLATLEYERKEEKAKE